MERVACDLCGYEQSVEVYEVIDSNYGSPGSFSIVQCPQCKLVYQNPRPSPVEISAYYPTKSYHPFKALYHHEFIKPAPLHLHRAAFLTALIGTGKVLDVGCGSGLFLQAMQQKGWHCEGVEPNEAAAQFGRDTLKIQVYTGDIFLFKAQTDFDLITFWDVLEHTHSPKNVLQHAAKLLKPDGYVAINVPNWGGIERRLFRQRWIAIDAPRHLYHFTPGTLTTLLENCGFVPIMVKARAPALSLSSNLLRWAGDIFLRQGKAKANTKGAPEKAHQPSNQLQRRYLIKLTHLLMKLPNAVANFLNLGASIMVIANKPLKQ